MLGRQSDSWLVLSVATAAHAWQVDEFFLYLFCHDFRKIKGRIKNFEKNTSGAVPTVGHDVRGGANGQLYWPVGPDSCRYGARQQDSWRRGPRRHET
jgi:hypothetical protein